MNTEAYARAMREAGVPCEADFKRRDSLIVSIGADGARDGRSESESELFLRADGGMYYTQDMDEKPETAIALARECGGAETILGGEAQIDRPLKGKSADARRLMEVGETLARDFTGASVTVREDERRFHVLNSNGMNIRSAMRVYEANLSVSVNGADAEAVITAKTPEALDLTACRARVEKALALRALPAVGILASGCPAVLSGAVVRNMLIAAWRTFDAEKTMSGASALSGLLGQTVGSPALSITDAPSREGCGYEFLFDDEGASAPARYLIKNGELTGLLHTRLTANKTGVSPTANAGRVATLTGSVPTAIIPMPRIICVEPGEGSQEDLLKDMGEGLFVDFSFDVFHSIDVSSGSFSVPCAAVVVKNGTPCGRADNLTFTGHLRSLFSCVRRAADDLIIEPFFLRSYCLGAPSLLLERANIG